jgi:putative membrane protein
MKLYNKFLIISLIGIFIRSVVNPYDYFTRLLEIFPVVLWSIALFIIYKKWFTFSKTVRLFLWLRAIILLVWWHYTYALNPLFSRIQDYFHLLRNHYDRLWHLFQWLVPAMIFGEILIKKQIVKNNSRLKFFVVCICLSISVFYEFIERRVAMGTWTKADSFLGTQWDVWDTQRDMFMAFIGALISIIFFKLKKRAS